MSEQANDGAAAPATEGVSPAVNTQVDNTPDTQISAAPTAGAAGQGADAPRGALADQASAPSADQATSWPENWRTLVAGEDKSLLAKAERYADPVAMGKALFEAQKLIASRGRAQHPGKDATPEQLAEYAELSGIPQAPDGYAVALADGKAPEGQLKEWVDAFLPVAHARGLNNEAVNTAVQYFSDLTEKSREIQRETDDRYAQESVATLKEQWGGDFNRNVNLVKNMMAGWRDGVGDMLLSARTADGKIVGDHPDILSQFVAQARDINPTATLLPSGQQDMRGVSTRIEQIEALMGDRSSAYWRGPQADAMQQEFRDLVTARDKLKSRA